MLKNLFLRGGGSRKSRCTPSQPHSPREKGKKKIEEVIYKVWIYSDKSQWLLMWNRWRYKSQICFKGGYILTEFCLLANGIFSYQIVPMLFMNKSPPGHYLTMKWSLASSNAEGWEWGCEKYRFGNFEIWHTVPLKEHYIIGFC